MKKKWPKALTILSIWMLLLATFLPSIASAEASSSLANGEYTIDLQVLKDGSEDRSVMDDYVENTAKVFVENDEKFIELTLIKSDWIKVFQTKQNGTFTDAQLVSEDVAADTRVVRFPVDNFSAKLDAYTHVVIPIINYDNKYTVQIKFQPESLTEVNVEGPGEEIPEPTDPEEEPETPGEGETDPEEEPETPEEEETKPELADGKYAIELSALHATEDKASTMQGYLGNPATLVVKAGVTYLLLPVIERSNSFITDLRLENNGTLDSGEVISEDEAALTRVVKYEVSDITSIIKAEVDMYVPTANYRNTQKFRIALDVDSITAVVEEPTEPEEPTAPELADGKYTIGFNALHATEDKASSMQGYLGNPATLEVKAGVTYLLLPVIERSNSFITDLRLENNGTFDSGEVISEDEAALTRVVKYEVSDIVAIINAEVDMYVPAANYRNTQKFRLALDVDSITAVEEEPTEPEEPTAPELADGKYTIEFNALHATDDKPSSMQGYLGNPAKLEVKAGVTYLLLPVIEKPGSFITDLRLENNGTLDSGEVISEDEATLTRVVKYEVSDLTSIIKSEVDMYVPAANYSNTQKFRLAFDVESITEWKEEPVDPGEPGEETELAIGEYTIDFSVLKDGTTDISVMDGYTKKPAYLTVEKDKQYVDLTLTNSDWIKLFQTKQNGEWKDAVVISEDTATNTRVVRFAVKDIETNLDAFTHVVIPMLNYDNQYTVQVAFDSSSMKEVEDDSTEPEVTPPTVEEKDGKKTLKVQDVKNFTFDATKKMYELSYNGVSAFEMSSEIFAQLQADAKLSLSIDGNVTAIFPVALFKNEVKNGENILFTFDEVATKEGAVSKLYDFSVKIGQREITEFAQPVTLVFAVQAQLVKNWKDLNVVYVNEAGEKAEVIKPSSINQQARTVTADVTHFSVYGVFEVVAEQEETPENGLADGTYTIDFSVLKNNSNELSVMDDYTEKPATLVVKDSRLFVDLTLKNSDWIKLFQVEQNGTLMNAEVISVEEAANKRVVRFEVTDLAEKLNAYTHVVIPEINYDNYYDVQFLFDANSIKDLDGNPIPNPNPNPNPNPGPEQPGNGSDKDDVDQPSNDKDDDLNYDRDSDKNSNDNSSTPNNKKVTNSDTSDTAMIGFLVALLMGSAFWLIRKYRFGTL